MAGIIAGKTTGGELQEGRGCKFNLLAATIWCAANSISEAPIFSAGNRFQLGASVLLTSNNPQPSFEEPAPMIKAGDSRSFGVIFLPMHRIERVELDSPDGNNPVSQRVKAKAEPDPGSYPSPAANLPPDESLR